MMRRSLVPGGRMRANTPRHSRDPARTWLEERPFVRVARVLHLFGFESAFSRRFPPPRENRKPPVTAPEVSPPVQRLLASKKTVGLARWSAKPGYESICSMAGGR